jgi:hypothetical protein
MFFLNFALSFYLFWSSIPKIKSVRPLEAFSGSFLEKKSIFFKSPFASQIFNFLVKCIFIISLLLHGVSTQLTIRFHANGEFLCKWRVLFYKKKTIFSRKVPQISPRGQNSMQKERDDKNAFSEIIKDLRLNKC